MYEQHQSSSNAKGDGLRFDIKFCAPKQGKKGNLTNADIYRKNTEEDSFSTKFNLPIIKSQSREVLLAAGLTLNKMVNFPKWTERISGLTRRLQRLRVLFSLSFTGVLQYDAI